MVAGAANNAVGTAGNSKGVSALRGSNLVDAFGAPVTPIVASGVSANFRDGPPERRVEF